MDVTREGAREGSASFVDHSNRVILVAVSALSASVRGEHIIATAINEHLLEGKITNLLPLAALIRTPTDMIPQTLRRLGIWHDEAIAAELRRGSPGALHGTYMVLTSVHGIWHM